MFGSWAHRLVASVWLTGYGATATAHLDMSTDELMALLRDYD